MNWIFLVIISALASSLTKILQRVLLKNKNSDPFAFSFIFQITVALLLLIYTLCTHSLNIPNLSGLFINLIIMALFFSLGNLFTFKACKIIEASELSIIFASSTVWSVIAALFILGESLNVNKITGVILVVLGIVVVNWSKTKWKFNKGHFFALLGALLFGIALINDAFILNRFQSVSSYMMIAFAVPAIITLFYNPKSIKNIPFYLNKKTLFNLLICSFFYALSTITIFEAYKRGSEASIIFPISQISIIFTVIFGYFFLKEKNKLLNKIIGTILAFIGVLFLV
jgi:bacterial/archaeal transporter family protein